LVNGVSGGTAIARTTENGVIRVTESGEERLLETTSARRRQSADRQQVLLVEQRPNPCPGAGP
jgi:hypothetical protein